MYQFSRGQQLLELCEKYALDIPELTIRSELEESGENRRRVWEKLAASLKVMGESVEAGLAGNLRSAGGLNITFTARAMPCCPVAAVGRSGLKRPGHKPGLSICPGGK